MYPSGPEPEPNKKLKDGTIYWLRSIEPKLDKEDDKPKGVVIKSSEDDEYWDGNKFSDIRAQWFKIGSNRIKPNLKKAREINKKAKLVRTY